MIQRKWIFWLFALSIAIFPFLSCSGGDDPTTPDDGRILDEIFDYTPVITAHHLDLDEIRRISRFRSLVGHDYTDPHESCRSMKHFYEPLGDIDWTSLEVCSPARSTVIEIQAEHTDGYQISLAPEERAQVMIMIFHVDPVTVQVGDVVEAGQVLGNHASPWTMSDIAVTLRNNAGTDWRLVSQFELMTDDLWADYVALGFESRSHFIISAEERDADAVGCAEGGGFNGEGTLENWVTIQSNP